MTEKELRQQAKDNGINWATVLEIYAELRAFEQAERDYDAEIRLACWLPYSYNADCNRFWRVGLSNRFPRAFAEGDYTLIPRFDEVADQVRMQFPQFDTTEKLWDYLTRDFVRMTPRVKLLQQAMDAAEEYRGETVPF